MSSWKHRGILNLIYPINELQFVENPVIRALIDCNILYLQKYNPYLRIQKKFYLSFVREWVKKKKSQMSLRQRFAFFWFKRRHGLDYSSASSGSLGTMGEYDHLAARTSLDHEVVAYRPKTMLDENYDKINK